MGTTKTSPVAVGCAIYESITMAADACDMSFSKMMKMLKDSIKTPQFFKGMKIRHATQKEYEAYVVDLFAPVKKYKPYERMRGEPLLKGHVTHRLGVYHG